MQTRALAFLTRSLRQDSRLISHHGLRAAMAAVILFLFVVELQTQSIRVGGGGRFVGTVMNCCYWFLTLLGGIHFSTAIVEEKEEQTLPLLRMTGARPYAILAGKSLPRLATAILFLCVIAPFLILSITLGGVLPLGLVAAILNILCYAVMLSQIGLFASVISRTSRGAFTITSILWLAIELSHWWYGLADGYVNFWMSQELVSKDSFIWWLMYDVLGRVPEFSLWGNLTETLSPFTALTVRQDASFLERLASTADQVLHVRMSFQLLVAAIFFLASWALFGPCADREADSARPKAVSLKPGRHVPRTWKNALAWKSWQFVGGGNRWLLIRAVAAPLIVVSGALAILAGFGAADEPMAIAGISLVIGFIIALLNLARLFGRVLNDEIHAKTLAPLVMLPQRTWKTAWDTVRGILPATAAGFTTFAIAFATFVMMAIEEGANLKDVAQVVFSPWLWHFLSLAVLTIHLGLLLTTYLRYGGMVLAVVLLWFVAPMFFGVLTTLLAFMVGPAGGEDLIIYVVPAIFMAAELFLCVVIQRKLVERIEVLASQ